MPILRTNSDMKGNVCNNVNDSQLGDYRCINMCKSKFGHKKVLIFFPLTATLVILLITDVHGMGNTAVCLNLQEIRRLV